MMSMRQRDEVSLKDGSLVGGFALAYLASYLRWRPARLLLSRLPSVGASFPQFFIGLLLIPAVGLVVLALSGVLAGRQRSQPEPHPRG